MKTLINCFALTLLAYASIANAEKPGAEEPGAGKAMDETYNNGNAMHQDHCYKCHGDEMYTRDDRFVKTISALGKQVRRCKDNIGITWFDEDSDAVVHFLNKKYYKF